MSNDGAHQLPPYTLPDPLRLDNGQPVTDARTWRERRRPEILEHFRTQVYGVTPTDAASRTVDVFDDVNDALDGRARRRQVRLSFSRAGRERHLDLLLYVPKEAQRPVPLVVGLNFHGNHTVHPDPAIKLPDSWVNSRSGGQAHRAQESGRGTSASRWPIETILARGYGVATIYYGDIEPDFNGGFSQGVRALFDDADPATSRPDAWAAIGAWAWGLSRALDYLEQDADIDGTRVSVMGHSRLGKTALWAGALDERFALVISNDSGCGGASLSRRETGETVAKINTSFPHWFCSNFKRYGDDVSALPIDQHMLIALMAPRPVYVASAEEDLWADPPGEFLSAKHAGPVYRLLATDGLAADEMPPVNTPIHSTIGYHIRPGKHDVTAYDWEQFLNFADRRLATATRSATA